MKASVRSRLPKAYLYARQNRRQMGRIKAHIRWHYPCCHPWSLEPDHYFYPLWNRRSFFMRLYALEWLRILAPLEPLLRGPLADEDHHRFDPSSDDEPDIFADCIEIQVDCDEIAFVQLLARMGHRAEQLERGIFMIENALIPIEVSLRERNGALKDDPTCDAAILEQRLSSSVHRGYRSLVP